MTSTTGGSQVTAPRAKESSYPVEGAVGRYDQTPADPDVDYVQVRAVFVTFSSEFKLMEAVTSDVWHRASLPL